MSSDGNGDQDAYDGDGQGRDREGLAAEKPGHGKRENSGADDDGDVAPYTPGYKHPPMHSRVVKGQVLNPNGRPKGSKNRTQTPAEHDIYRVILEEAYRRIPVADAGEATSMPMVQAIIRSTLVHAAKGNTRAQRHAADLIRTAQLDTKRQREEAFAIALEYRASWKREFARQKQSGHKGPAPLPHPDHVVLDLTKGQVHIKGPATEEERAAWARWKHYRPEFEAELRELETEQKHSSCPDPEGPAAEIEHTRGLLRIIGLALDGNRDAMGLLEEVFADLVRAYPDCFRESPEP
jgi:hypothetical protein